ncbi:hypothetical protein H8L32_11385 [Undibacterium sp. CY18W]|uniref:Lipoprotein n=1 Tax=Undibacterium hunanense TaxID=2762292 RepID=A0ABR6ZQC1_9BURK|nr:hypothetical protein [Undibacterium hunanense]MBC3918081.1 hypothetical protein [Undibacterium hunanense]
MSLIKFLGSVLFLLVLAACGRTESVQTLERRDLMRLVFKGWDGEQNAVVKPPLLKAEFPVSVSASLQAGLRMDALQVQRLNEDSAVLLVKGDTLDAGKPTLLAAYWFHRRGEAWSLVSRQDVIEWLDNNGRNSAIGNTSIIELFPGQFALALEHSQLKQGVASTRLLLFRIDANNLVPMLDKTNGLDLAVHEESGPECVNIIRNANTASSAHARGRHVRLRVHENEAEPPNCHDYLAKWDIAMGSTAPGDITLNFADKHYRYQELAHTMDNEGERTSTYELQVSAQKGKKLFHFDADQQKYVVVPDKARQKK